MNPKMITEQDRVLVRGRYLVYEQDPSQRFLMRGMAFPVSLYEDISYSEEGWIAVLKQLRKASPHINTLRLYRIHLANERKNGKHKNKISMNISSSTVDNPMAGFYQAAAELGFYLIVPLTAAAGDGVLDRGKAAPSCYNAKLFHYGAQVIESVKDHPNVLGGVLGNEVLNSLKDWLAAPCLLAYARDLKRFHPHFPLIYTTQHNGLTAVVKPAATAQLLLNYLTCHDEGLATIDVLGINIESWCSSLQKFERNEDGTEGPYLDLYRHLENATIPLIFSELGCSQILYNRDNGLGVALEAKRTARDWQQVSVVESTMADEWSGFIAYAYDGPNDFCMTDNGPWDGVHPLPFNLDMENYIQALDDASALVPNMTILSSTEANATPPTCALVHDFLRQCCGLDLLDVKHIPSYFISAGKDPPGRWAVQTGGEGLFKMIVTWGLFGVAMVGCILYASQRRWRKGDPEEAAALMEPNKGATYDTFA